jgi:DNA gyrase subunit A
VNFLALGSDEKITSTMINRKIAETKSENCIIMATKNGIIKKVKLSDFDNVRRSGIIVIKLKGSDELKWAEIASGKDEIILVTAKGQAIRFKEAKVRPMGRTAGGVRAIRLKSGDFVRSMDILSPEKAASKNQRILVVTENGFGKTTALKEYKVQGRGGSGIKTAKITPKTGAIVRAAILGDEAKEKDLLVISQKGQTIRVEISAVPSLGRATQGVRIMRLNAGDKIASTAVI